MNIAVLVTAFLIAAFSPAPAFSARAADSARPCSRDRTCRISVNGSDVQCDLVLFQTDNRRTRIQFNNDDSGRMIIFEGSSLANESIPVDGITVGLVSGRADKVKLEKATGICVFKTKTVECNAQTSDKMLVEGSLSQ